LLIRELLLIHFISNSFEQNRCLYFGNDNATEPHPQGDAEADASPMLRTKPPLHFYSTAAEMFRAFTELGRVRPS
jgi:hypothetical protein